MLRLPNFARLALLPAAFFGVCLCTGLTAADTAPTAPPAVANVKLVSDKVEDVSSLEAWQASVIKPTMSAKEQALAAWETTCKFRHHDTNPIDWLGFGNPNCNDGIALFNCYGYCGGVGAQISFLQLVRSAGLEAQAWSLFRWGGVDVKYDNAWHYMDPGFMCYFLDDKGNIASVEDISKSVKDWYEKNPGFKDEDKKIRAFIKDPGIEKGPALLSNCPTFDQNKSFPLNFFAWYTTMMTFNGGNNTPFLYEEMHTQGHRVNLTLHRGESITRYWNADHLPATWFKDGAPDCLKASPGKGVLYYTPKFGDLGNGRVGSGEVSYTPPLDASFLAACLSADNVEIAWHGAAKKPIQGFSAKNPANSAVVVLARSNGYVYAGGQLSFYPNLDGGSVAVAVSWDNGLSWKEAGEIKKGGEAASVDLTPLIAHHYQYRLKLTLTGKNTSVSALQLTEQFQCSQRPLPALAKGANKLGFSVGPQEGTVTVVGTNPKFKEHQATWEDCKVVFAGCDMKAVEQNGALVGQGKTTSVTVPIEAPNDLVRLRFGCEFRAGGKNEGWDYQVSFDDGKSWKTVDRAAGPVRNSTKYIAFTDIPKGTKKALVRYQGDSAGNLVMFGFRVDADYALPHAGVQPVQVTVVYKENGKDVKKEFAPKTAAETFSVDCAAQPVMESVTLALP